MADNLYEKNHQKQKESNSTELARIRFDRLQPE